jgi:hypothetical protein
LLQWIYSSSRPQNDTKNYEAQGFIVEEYDFSVQSIGM